MKTTMRFVGKAAAHALLGALVATSITTMVVIEQASAYQPGKLLSKMLDGPLAEVQDILFTARVAGRDHWYVNFGYYSCDYGDGPKRAFGMYPDGVSLRGYGEGCRLCRMNLRSGKLTLLIDDPKGGVRDPQLHYSGKKALFSYRKGESATFHLYEINIDGSNLKQLTFGPDDDIEPTYLPDGGIMFCSSRSHRFVNCWFSRVANLYRCESDGSQIRMISSNNDHDNTPWVLPDGRVLYMRWEYVDRSQVHFHHLWVCNPDGTSQMIWYGNEFGGIAMLDAKPIPGTDKVVASFSPGHGRPEHMGYVTIVDPNGGPDIRNVTRRVSKKNIMYRDPYPVDEHCFLVANSQGILVMDEHGETELIYQLPPKDRHMQCHAPRPIRSRPREPIVRQKVDLSRETGQLVLANIYQGRNMEGVKRGEIKKMLVLQQLPEPVHFSGGMLPISIGGTFTMAEILGTVPVEPDGSAYFEVPALRSLFLVALDEDDLSVKRMQSFVTVQPGEKLSCVGCHEQRSQTAPANHSLLALKRRPRKITPIDDIPDVFDFPRDIQPILDRHCVECHNPDRRDGGVDLCGDHSPMYSNSYQTITARHLVSDGRNQPYGNREPRTIGSSASRLMRLIDGSHHDVQVSATEKKFIRLWIDSSATYPGTYAALGSGMYPPNLPWQMLVDRCATCHGNKPNKGHRGRTLPPQVLQSCCNLTRPEKSLILQAPLAKSAGGLQLCHNVSFKSKSDPGYQATLKAIRVAAAELQAEKRFDMPGFRPKKFYIREMQRFGILPKTLGPNDPVDPYLTDRAYWKSFWHKPVAPQPRTASHERLRQAR